MEEGATAHDGVEGVFYLDETFDHVTRPVLAGLLPSLAAVFCFFDTAVFAGGVFGWAEYHVVGVVWVDPNGPDVARWVYVLPGLAAILGAVEAAAGWGKDEVG